MLSRFFINRPIFAAVISIVIVLAGAITLTSLPVAQYPEIAPPTVTVSTFYPGANAQVLADTVAAPIEQEVNGVEGMIYMSSTCSSDGSYSLTITFDTGVDLDMASVLVQNRVAVAMNRLPEEVKRSGVTTKKRATNFAVLINIISTDGRYDDVYLSNFASLNLKDELSRLPGSGDVQVLGAGDYSMRIWMDPQKLKARNMTTSDLVSAIQEQNVQVAAGIIGRPPAPKGQDFQYTVSVKGRLKSVEEFENIIVKTGEGGRLIRVKDVARVELGSETYDVICQLDGKPSALIQIFQLPGANLLDLSERVKKTLETLSEKFPESVEYQITYDASDVVKESIDEIVTTLFIAAVLVILTVFVFLQDIRATLIPAVTIPISLIGTFTVMAVLGFSINTLTLFGLVLAIGIVVDDAIVVVENTMRNIDEGGLTPKEATIKAMGEVTGPVIATTLVLMAVFIPTAFMGGMTGIMYKQFALTIATTTVFSSINALTMSPALCALVLRPTPERRNVFFRIFDQGLDLTRNTYMRIVGWAVRRSLITLVLFVGITVAAFYGLVHTPTGFVPEEDQGYMVISIQLPVGASQERTYAVVQKVDAIVTKIPGVANCITGTGYSLLDGTVSSNMAFSIVVLKPWNQRETPELSQYAIIGQMRAAFSKIQEAIIMPFLTPALPGLGMAGGFEMEVEDRGSVGLDQLQQYVGELIQDGNAQNGLTGLYTTFMAGVPQIFVDVDRTKVKTLGIPMSTVFGTMQAYLGSAYVNDFNKFGQSYQVYVQADSKFRAHKRDITQLEVRTNQGNMVPLGTLVKVEQSFGPQVISRYNMYPSATINGSAAPGYSSGEALKLMAQMAEQKLPTSMGFEWTGISYQETVAGSQAAFILAMAVIFVYLVLAAQYESWKIPTPVILAVPLALLGAVVAVKLRQLDNNTYTQIGLVLLVGLATKNAILIVEFAKDNYDKGMDVIDAAMTAARLRFRPILMTAFSFILGVLPLLIATGAGAGSRRALGTAVFGGMLAATILGVVFVPPLYRIFQTLGFRRHKESASPETAPPETTAETGENNG